MSWLSMRMSHLTVLTISDHLWRLRSLVAIVLTVLQLASAKGDLDGGDQQVFLLGHHVLHFAVERTLLKGLKSQELVQVLPRQLATITKAFLVLPRAGLPARRVQHCLGQLVQPVPKSALDFFGNF